MRLGNADGTRARITFQDAAVRRPILSVGESTSAGNLYVFDDAESALIPKGSPEISEIRKLVQRAKNRLKIQKENNIYRIEAWVDPAEASVFGR